MLLTPRMAYQREFFGEGLFMCGPAGAIFRPEVFRELGGFADRGRRVGSSVLDARVHDDERAAAAGRSVLVPAAPRRRNSRARRASASTRACPASSGARSTRPDCPLTPEEREQAKRNRAYHLARRTLQDLRRGRWRLAVEPRSGIRT